jgi:hypothetical protein
VINGIPAGASRHDARAFVRQFCRDSVSSASLSTVVAIAAHFRMDRGNREFGTLNHGLRVRCWPCRRFMPSCGGAATVPGRNNSDADLQNRSVIGRRLHVEAKYLDVGCRGVVPAFTGTTPVSASTLSQLRRQLPCGERSGIELGWLSRPWAASANQLAHLLTNSSSQHGTAGSLPLHRG